MKYQESEQSKKLMELNAYYINNNASALPIKDLIRIKLNNAFKYFKNLICLKKNGLKKTYIKLVSKLNPNIYIDHFGVPQPSSDIEINFVCKNEEISGKVAVYTSVFGNYDAIKEPLFRGNKCDYFAITDQDIPANSIWKKLDCSNLPGFNDLDNYHKSKYCKLFPHKLFPNYDYSIWVDGNVQIVADLYPLIDKLANNHVMGTFENPLHDCIYTEKNYLIFIDAAKTEDIEYQINEYKKSGFPAKFGMREFSIIMRKHSDNILQNLMQQWWEHCNKYTMRDQISLPYILWENGLTIDYIQKYPGNWRMNPRFIFSPHNWRYKF